MQRYLNAAMEMRKYYSFIVFLVLLVGGRESFAQWVYGSEVFSSAENASKGSQEHETHDDPQSDGEDSDDEDLDDHSTPSSKGATLTSESEKEYEETLKKQLSLIYKEEKLAKGRLADSNISFKDKKIIKEELEQVLEQKKLIEMTLSDLRKGELRSSDLEERVDEIKSATKEDDYFEDVIFEMMGKKKEKEPGNNVSSKELQARLQMLLRNMEAIRRHKKKEGLSGAAQEYLGKEMMALKNEQSSLERQLKSMGVTPYTKVTKGKIAGLREDDKKFFSETERLYRSHMEQVEKKIKELRAEISKTDDPVAHTAYAKQLNLLEQEKLFVERSLDDWNHSKVDSWKIDPKTGEVDGVYTWGGVEPKRKMHMSHEGSELIHGKSQGKMPGDKKHGWGEGDDEPQAGWGPPLMVRPQWTGAEIPEGRLQDEIQSPASSHSSPTGREDDRGEWSRAIKGVRGGGVPQDRESDVDESLIQEFRQRQGKPKGAFWGTAQKGRAPVTVRRIQGGHDRVSHMIANAQR